MTGFQPDEGRPPNEATSPSGDFVDPNLAAPYAGHYPVPPPGYGYSAAGYPVVGYPSPPQRYEVAPGRPGTLTAASVLCYVQAGLLLIATLMLFYGASVVNDFDEGNGVTAELVVDGLIDVVLAGVFIWGGVLMAIRRPFGRAAISGAGVACAIVGIYWVVRFPFTVVAFYMIVFLALPATAAGLAWSTAAHRWLMAANPRNL